MQHNLYDIDKENVPNIFYKDQTVEALVIDVYDGDTITVIFLIDTTPIKIKIRLKGIDTPEIRAGKGRFKKEKEAAKVCRDYLSSKILDKIINLTILDWDKYGGRIIGTVLIDDININDSMLEEGYAIKYDGKKKHRWKYSELIKIIKNN